MENLKYVPFMLFFTTSLLALDYYFIYSLRKFVIINKKPSLLYKIPIIIAIFMGFVSIYIIWTQIGNILPGKTEKVLFDLQSIWYLPKILIAPVILIRDIYRRLDKKSSKSRIPKSNQLTIKPSRRKLPDLKPNLALQTNNYGTCTLPDTQNNLNQNSSQINTSKDNYDRRKFIKDSSWALAGVPFIMVSHGALETTYHQQIHTVDLYLKNLPIEFDGFKIVQLSDIHAGSFHSSEPIEEAVSIANKLRPDLVAITGDFVNYKCEEWDMAIDAISQLRSKYGSFGCLGNHDHFMSRTDTQKLIGSIEKSSVAMLMNENAVISIGNASIALAGVDNCGYGQHFADFDKAIEDCQDKTTILLCHDPANWRKEIKAKREVDLMLAGHTHGGQAGINIGNQFFTPAMLVHSEFAGLYKCDEQYLYVNRGLGNSGIPFRVGINPEITEITLRRSVIS